MRFCLIDADVRYRRILRYQLEVAWSDAAIAEFDTVADERLTQSALAEFDLVLLGCPEPGRHGLDGLAHLLDRNRYPPVLLFAEPGDELLAVDALKAGAVSYFPKGRVTYRRLVATIENELSSAGRVRQVAASSRVRPMHYRYLKLLHSNDQATVYLAERRHDDASRLAVKVIRYAPGTGSEHRFDRFLQEYEIIAAIDHPNVVRVVDFGVADDHAYLAMEYLGAGRLSDRLGTGMPAARAVDYLAQIAGALQAVHSAGILHRDLKPANIMFRDDQSLALIDFGLAKRMRLERSLTDHGQIFGTPYYMSPEQGHAEATDERSDLYSLGCIFYELLTGSRPFAASSAMGLIYRHANATRPSLPSALSAEQPLLDRLLAIDPEARFQSAADLIDAIDARGTFQSADQFARRSSE